MSTTIRAWLRQPAQHWRVAKAAAEMRKMAPETTPVVLVVEDDHLIRMNAASIIEEAGYDVVEASNADDAIAILEARKDIRIVFTDIEMPGSMDGLKLARAIRDRWPPIELVITSGKHKIEPDELPPRGQFVPKPYDPGELIPVIRSLAG